MAPKESFSLNFANAVKDPWDGGVDLYLADKQPGRIAIVSSLIFTMYHPEEAKVIPSPASIRIDQKTAFQLMNALWGAGIRPSGELDSIGHLDALKAHLADMRQLTFKTLSVEKP